MTLVSMHYRLFTLVAALQLASNALADHFTDDMITKRIDQLGGVEAYQQDVATKLNRVYPRPMGTLLEATTAEAQGADIVYRTHLIDADLASLPVESLTEKLRADLSPLYCDNQATRPLIVLYGAAYRVTVVDALEQPLTTLEFNSASCHPAAD